MFEKKRKSAFLRKEKAGRRGNFGEIRISE